MSSSECEFLMSYLTISVPNVLLHVSLVSLPDTVTSLVLKCSTSHVSSVIGMSPQYPGKCIYNVK